MVAALLASAAAPGIAQHIVKTDGSSTVFPLAEALADEFQKKRGIKVALAISGTTAGLAKLCRGETDIAGASRPIAKAEMAACAKAGVEYYELPVAFDAITVVVNPKNDFVAQLTVAELKKMWEPAAESRVARWADVNPRWPDLPLRLFGPGRQSGTFDYFTEAVVGRPRASRADVTASEDDLVLVQGVARTPGALGYFGYAYYLENRHRLRAVPIVNDKGVAVDPSPEAVAAGRYRPLSRPVFLYANAASLTRAGARQFVEYSLANAARAAQDVGLMPLPAAAYELAAAHLRNGKKGTVFGGGSGLGVSVEELMRLEARL
jgi:phosphate transport system substrate-binding protein